MASDFPSVQPAFIMSVNIGVPMLVGSVSRGTACTVVPITGGTIRSQPGSEVELDASFIGTGNDYLHNDADGCHMRLDAHVVARQESRVADELVYIKWSGVVDVTPELTAILGGSADAKSTEYGHSFIHLKFETGASRLKALEIGVYVASGRFHVHDDFSISVDYMVGRVVASRRSDS